MSDLYSMPYGNERWVREKDHEAQLAAEREQREAAERRVMVLTKALEAEQVVEDHTLECAPCLWGDTCNVLARLRADAGVLRADALLQQQQPEARGSSSEEGVS